MRGLPGLFIGAAVVLLIGAAITIAVPDDDTERLPGQDEEFRGWFCVGHDLYLDLSVNPDDAPAIREGDDRCGDGSQLPQWEDS